MSLYRERAVWGVDAVQLAALNVDHWPQVATIYAAGIATGHATFVTEPPSWEAFEGGKRPEQRAVSVAGRW